MSEHEITELVIQWVGLGLVVITLYLTVLSGYVVFGLSVAKDLSRLQLLFVTVVFALFEGFFTFGTFTMWENARATLLIYPLAGFNMPAYWGQIIAVTEMLGIIGALFFVYSLRQKRT